MTSTDGQQTIRTDNTNVNLTPDLVSRSISASTASLKTELDQLKKGIEIITGSNSLTEYKGRK